MQFLYSDTSELYIMEFGRVVRGIQRKGTRPLNCYISPKELEKEAYYVHHLADYLRTIQHALQPGGRVVIR